MFFFPPATDLSGFGCGSGRDDSPPSVTCWNKQMSLKQKWRCHGMGGYVSQLWHLLQWFQMCTNALLRKRKELCASSEHIQDWTNIYTKNGLGESGSHLYRLSSSILVLKPSKRNLKTSFPQACRYDPSGRLTWLSSGHCVIGLIEASTVAAESWALQNSSPQTELQSQLQSQLQRSAELKSILMYK